VLKFTSAFASLKTFQMSQFFDSYNSVLQVLIENYRTSVKNKCSHTRTETSEILKSHSHFKIGSHLCYVCFCFTL